MPVTVPDTKDFDLKDVRAAIDDHSGTYPSDLQQCFNDAEYDRFDLSHYNDGNDLLEFRNYGCGYPLRIQPTALYVTVYEESGVENIKFEYDLFNPSYCDAVSKESVFFVAKKDTNGDYTIEATGDLHNSHSISARGSISKFKCLDKLQDYNQGDYKAIVVGQPAYEKAIAYFSVDSSGSASAGSSANYQDPNQEYYDDKLQEDYWDWPLWE